MQPRNEEVNEEVIEIKEEQTPTRPAPLSIMTQSSENNLSFFFDRPSDSSSMEGSIIELEEIIKANDNQQMDQRNRSGSFRIISIRQSSQPSFESQPLDAKAQQSFFAKTYKFVKDDILSFYALNLPDTPYYNIRVAIGRLMQTGFSLYNAYHAYQNTHSDLETNPYFTTPDAAITVLSIGAAILSFLILQKGVGYGIHRLSIWNEDLEKVKKESTQNRQAIMALAKTVESSVTWEDAQRKAAKILAHMKKGEQVPLQEPEEDNRGCLRRLLGW